MLGYTDDECLGKSFLPLVNETDHQWVTETHQAHSQGALVPSSSEIRLFQKSGQEIDCIVHNSTVEWEGRSAVLAVFEDVTEKKRLDAELRRLASIDMLTELAARDHFFHHLEQALSRLKRGIDQAAAVLVVELDHFEVITESLGQLAGDSVLHLFSALMRDELRKVDFAGRVEHQTFAVLLPEADRSAATTFAERLRKKAAGTSIVIDSRQVSITLSIGIAWMRLEDESADQAFLRAEETVASARIDGGDRIAIAETARPSIPNGTS